MEKQVLFNKRKVFFLIIYRFGYVLAGAFLGAVLAVAIRVTDKLVINNTDRYVSESTVYLVFAEGKLEDDQYYNGYTWGQLMTTEKILGHTMLQLGEGYDREYVKKAVTAEILADVRVMTVKVTTENADKTNAIMEATLVSLEHFTGEVDTFESITPWEVKEAVYVKPDLQLIRFGAVGAACGLLLALLWVWIKILISDTICTSEEFSIRFGIPVAAMYKDNGELFLPNEVKINYAEWFPNEGALVKRKGLISLDVNTEDIELPTDLVKLEYQKLTAEDYRLLQENGNNVLAIKWGTANGNMIEHAIEQLGAHKIKITHAIICGAKENFLKSYYKMK